MAELDPKATRTTTETNFPGGLTARGRPVPTDEEIQAAIAKAVAAGVATVDTLKELGLASGVAKVTGKATVASGLAAVTKALVAFKTKQSANAAFVNAKASAEAGKIDIEVLKSDFSESATEVEITWVALA